MPTIGRKTHQALKQEGCVLWASGMPKKHARKVARLLRPMRKTRLKIVKTSPGYAIFTCPRKR